jgi:hypothetical protein
MPPQAGQSRSQRWVGPPRDIHWFGGIALLSPKELTSRGLGMGDDGVGAGGFRQRIRARGNQRHGEPKKKQ